MRAHEEMRITLLSSHISNVHVPSYQFITEENFRTIPILMLKKEFDRIILTTIITRTFYARHNAKTNRPTLCSQIF